MRRSPRRPSGFNLSFLDVMSCGLGAIILIFMLVKYQTEQTDVEQNALRAEWEKIKNEADEMEANNDTLAAQIEQLKKNLDQQIKDAAQSKQTSTAVARELIKRAKDISALEKKLAQQKKQNAAEELSPESPVDKTLEDHLIGLRVTGSRITILLDSSASMADERLVDIIKIKASTDIAKKKAAPKWRRALAAVKWVIERVPKESEYRVIHYSADADFVVDKKWIGGDDVDARMKVFEALEALYPHGETNLSVALKLIESAPISPTDMYVITDGLPTKGTLSVLKKLKGCGKKNTVSGNCRRELFYAAVQAFSPTRTKINTVLFPIEGDPEAAYAYWLWSAATTGVMISPAGSWP